MSHRASLFHFEPSALFAQLLYWFFLYVELPSSNSFHISTTYFPKHRPNAYSSVPSQVLMGALVQAFHKVPPTRLFIFSPDILSPQYIWNQSQETLAIPPHSTQLLTYKVALLLLLCSISFLLWWRLKTHPLIISYESEVQAQQNCVLQSVSHKAQIKVSDSPGNLASEKSASQLLQVAGRINFLVAIGPRPPQIAHCGLIALSSQRVLLGPCHVVPPEILLNF